MIFFIKMLNDFVVTPDKIIEYQPITIDGSENYCFYARTEETDFNKILEKIDLGSDNQALNAIEEMKNPWAIIIEYTIGKNRVIGISKIRRSWNIMKKFGVQLGIKSGIFKKVTADNVIGMPSELDFIWSESNFFIRNKDNYETTLNKREGLIIKKK